MSNEKKMPELDAVTTITELRQVVRSFIEAREWQQFHTPKNLSMSLAVEASELMELFIWAEGRDASHAQLARKRREVEQELADIVILTVCFANNCGIDIMTAVKEKFVENAKKYPVEKARGRSEKYTEL